MKIIDRCKKENTVQQYLIIYSKKLEHGNKLNIVFNNLQNPFILPLVTNCRMLDL